MSLRPPAMMRQPVPGFPAPNRLTAEDGAALLPGTLCCFPPPDDSDHAGWHRRLSDRLAELTRQAEEDPYANPIQLLALDIGRRLDKGELSLGALEQLIQRLVLIAFVERADRLGRRLGECDPRANERRLRALIGRLAEGRSFAEFQALVAREHFGIVMTAHPTFALTPELLRIAAQLASARSSTGVPLSGADRNRLIDQAARLEHRPPRGIDLGAEHALSLEAIGHLQAALRHVFGIAVDVAREAYPDRWRELRPRLVTVASWVGYDMDGRSDIKWSDSLVRRLELLVAQVGYYRGEVMALLEALPAESAARHALTELDDRLAATSREARVEIVDFQAVGRSAEGGQGASRAGRPAHACGPAGPSHRDGAPARAHRRGAGLGRRGRHRAPAPGAAGGDGGPWPGLRPYPCPPQRLPDPQRHPQDDRAWRRRPTIRRIGAPISPASAGCSMASSRPASISARSSPSGPRPSG